MFNRSEIMKAAWKFFRNSIKNNWGYSFGECLKTSWKQAKAKAELDAKAQRLAAWEAEKQAAWQARQDSKARAVAALSVSDKATYDALKKEMFLIDMIDRWSDKDRERRDELQARIDVLETEKAPATIVAKAA